MSKLLAHSIKKEAPSRPFFILYVLPALLYRLLFKAHIETLLLAFTVKGDRQLLAYLGLFVKEFPEIQRRFDRLAVQLGNDVIQRKPCLLRRTGSIQHDHTLLDLPEDALVLTTRMDAEGRFAFTAPDGRYLSAVSGSMWLTDGPAEGSRSLWTLRRAEGGWNILSAGDDSLAVELYSGVFTTYRPENASAYLFNFYAPKE